MAVERDQVGHMSHATRGSDACVVDDVAEPLRDVPAIRELPPACRRDAATSRRSGMRRRSSRFDDVRRIAEARWRAGSTVAAFADGDSLQRTARCRVVGTLPGDELVMFVGWHRSRRAADLQPCLPGPVSRPAGPPAPARSTASASGT